MIKLILITLIPLTNDEAYYWVWSQHPQLSYFDHPPFVAWLFGLGEHLRFIPGGVRWPGVWLAHFGLGLWLLILKPILPPNARAWWLALALTSPLLGGSALIITPDVPLLFFYAVATWAYLRWRERATFARALGLGLAMGLGLTSKYMMVLFPLGPWIPTLASPDGRRALWRGWPAILAGGLVGTCPVWLWNLTNDFASFRFQAHHGLGHTFWKPSWTTEYVGLQLALVTPWLAYFAWRGRRSAPSFLGWLAITPFVFFLFTTARGYVEANWPIAAYPATLALAVAYAPARRWWAGTAAVWATLLAVLSFAIVTAPANLSATKLREFHHFDGVVARVHDVTPLYARSYQMASRLSFDLGRPVYKVRGMLRHDFFDELPGSVPPAGEYWVVFEPGDRLPDEFLARGDHVVEVTPIEDRFGSFELARVKTR